MKIRLADEKVWSHLICGFKLSISERTVGADISQNSRVSDNVNPRFSYCPLIRGLGHVCSYSGCNKPCVRGNYETITKLAQVGALLNRIRAVDTSNFGRATAWHY